MAALPQIGSTLSLISNADIRYEGELFTVNPKECTIALCNVRSYGTEDRITSVRVEPHPNTYDYILFRGSDIKDIKIVGPPRRTIVSAASVSTVVDSQSAKPAKPTSSSNESDAANSSTATAVPTNAEKSSTRTTSSEDEVLSPIRKNNSADLVDDSLKQQYIAGGGSSFSSKKDSRTNSTSALLNLSSADAVKRQDIVITAQPLSFSKQQSDGAVIRSTSSTSQSNSFKNHDSAKPKRNVADNVRSSAVQRPYQQTSFHQDGGGGYHQKEMKPPQQNYYSEGGINKSLGKTTGQSGRYHRGNNFYGNRGAPASRYEDQMNNSNRYYGGNVRNNEMFNRYRDMESNWHYGGAVSSATARANWGDRNYSVRNNGRMDGGSPGRFYNQPTMIYRSNARSDFRSTNNNATNNRKIMEFNSDYDFEQANMKFEELKSQLAKVKISSDGELTDDASNKDESSLNANADESTDNSAKSNFYDKSKSFFDHISCETLEKSKGTPTRTNWRNERKLNSETFGTIAVRGGYRGRGGYIQNRAANMRGAARSAGHYYGYGRY